MSPNTSFIASSSPEWISSDNSNNHCDINNNHSMNQHMHHPSLKDALKALITTCGMEYTIRQLMGCGTSEYLKYVPKHELIALCWYMRVEKEQIIRGYRMEGTQILVEALLQIAPIVGSSEQQQLSLREFLSATSYLYDVIKGKEQVFSCNQQEEEDQSSPDDTNQERIQNSFSPSENQ
ncbi:hypothetical protein FDP41_013493 [Naegleria fowleri]|uniref:Uncharacterized protein n=1 Tax=Naegleria fowleri TaxID=5763 RepID=A0A6A5C4L8_NAEFO|nr:uncharacterized protein FDP41_013493 [Naegleria fowleri]KAF0980279.1 hypothetical protein FDP41_013493 [Naegleria fowleri]CAG4716813.1 unnamed protein product [Naegleria fowleri]